MDLPLTGSKEIELLFVSTEKMDVIIKGKPSHPTAEVLNLTDDYCSKVTVKCNDCGIIQTPINGMATESNAQQTLSIIPMFFEHQNYQVVIEPKTQDTVTFWHENPILRDSVDYVGHGKRFLMGLLNFGSEVGNTDLIFRINSDEYLTINLEIFPSKIDYKDDYIQILRDVNEEIHNLAFDFLRKTYLWSNMKDEVGNSPTEFWSIIKLIYHKFIKAVDIVLQMPHHVLIQREEVLPAHKVKKYNQKSINWLQRNPRHFINIDGSFTPQKVLSIQKAISYDTFENRMIKHIMKLVIRKLKQVYDTYIRLQRESDHVVIKMVEQMTLDINRRVTAGFLNEVGELHTTNVLSLVMNMAPGYKDVFKYYLMIVRGLSLEGDIFKISMKNLAELYEYWCFIKLNGILKKKYKLISQDMIQGDYNGLFVRLKKGRKAEVNYLNPRTGERFTLSYNQLFQQLPTGSQKPDNVLSLKKERSDIEYKYIFDAKYRFNPKGAGPVEGDINTMHRYRDAIVHSNKNEANFEKMVFGAYVLFPYHKEEKYRTHPFYESIQKVNVGGLPFLPSATNLVEEFLEELIEDSPESAFERSTLPKGMLEYIERINFDDKEVLVGSLRSKEQLEINKENNFYHIPYKNIKPDPASFKYIALYQKEDQSEDRQGGIWSYGKVKEWKVIRRKELEYLIKVQQNNPNQLYVFFEVEKWINLDTPIRPQGYGVRKRVYTSYYQLKNAKYLPELCIRSKIEYRLFLELKRLTKRTKIVAQQKKIDDCGIERIYLGGVWINVTEDKIQVYNDSSHQSYLISKFKKNPTGIIRQIKKWVSIE